MAAIDINLRFLTLNVQSIRNKKTRQTLFRSFKSSKFDIIALQETHLTNSDFYTIQNEWTGSFHLSEGSTQSKGLLTLFNQSISHLECSIVQKNERVMTSLIKIDHEKHILVSNVYSPSDSYLNRILFLDSLRDLISNIYDRDVFDSSLSIILGDFNACLNNDLDIISGNKHPTSLVSKFNEFVNDLNINDVFRLSYPTRKDYTWSKREKHHLLSCRRLDYIFTTDDLLPYIKSIEIKSFGFSDHRGVEMQVDFKNFPIGPSCYKLNTDILKDLSFVNLVKSEINKMSNLSNSLSPSLMWECIKAQIRSLGINYSKSKSRSNKLKKYDLECKLSHLESLFSQNPGSSDLESQIIKTKNELEIFSLAETKGAQIRAGIKFSELGEKCNKFFLGLEKSRSKSNTIVRVSEGNRDLTNCFDILDSLSNYYSNIYKSPTSRVRSSEAAEKMFLNSNNVNVLNDEERIYHNEIFSEDEILFTLKSMKNGSSPGLDGLPIEVYKVFWNDIKHFLINCIHDCFLNESLTPSQSQALLCLIHKGGDNPRELIASWRPISLLNSDYKLIAKLLYNRICSVTSKLVHSNQFAFIKGRNISVMLRELYDIIENEKKTHSNTILLSIDYSKAFDTLSTESILKALELYGFGDYFLKWIKIILSGRTCCVRNGGYISKEFNMERGVRQGCPISPILFILTSELFAANIRADPKIKGLKLRYSDLIIKILHYADDITLLLRDIFDFREILSRIKLFAEFSGLQLNIKKSYAMKLGRESWEGRSEQGIKFVNKLKILGIFFSSVEDARLLPENIDSRIKNLEKICSLWSRRILSLQGKILILKVYGLSLFVNVIQSIGITQDNLNIINKIFFRFIWRKTSSDKRVTERVKRSVLCSAKEHGGLNMINLKAFQQSFLLSWAEKILDETECDWKKIALQSLHKVGGLSSFMSNLPSSSFKGLSTIHNSFWREVLSTWLDQKNLGSSNFISPESPLFNNSNIKLGNNVLFFPELINRGIIYVKDVFANNVFISFESFHEKLNVPGSFLFYNCIYNALKPKLASLTNNPKNIPDDNKIILTKFQDLEIGSIGRKGFYFLLNPPETPLSELYWSRRLGYPFPKSFWSLTFKSTDDSRLQVLQWKILMNIYPTAIILSKMKIKTSDKCEECNLRETVEHFFYFCPKRKKIWNLVGRYISIYFSSNFQVTWSNAIFGIMAIDGCKKHYLKAINELLILAKHSISKSVYGSHQDPCIIFESELRNRKFINSYMWSK